MSEKAALTIVREDHVHAPGAVTLRINRPEVKNALGPKDLRLLNQHLLDCQMDSDVRVVLLTGTGDSFCAGADIKHRNERANAQRAGAANSAELANEVMTRIIMMPQIVVAAVNGAAAGLGHHMAVCSDLCIAMRTAQFHFTGARKGIPSQQLGALLLPLTLGLKRAKAILLHGGRLSAERAQQLGLVNEVVDPPEWKAVLAALAADLVLHDPRVMAHNKFQLNQFAYQMIGALKLSNLAGAAFHASTPYIVPGRVKSEKAI
jgi:enoyl-CoA hydratase/carnithine racemase